jgi:hypothetical protein
MRARTSLVVFFLAARVTAAKNTQRTHAESSLSLRYTSLLCGAYQQHHGFIECLSSFVDSPFIVRAGKKLVLNSFQDRNYLFSAVAVSNRRFFPHA